MNNLSKDWITEKHIDFEYKKYMVLAYLKKVSENFDQNRLYPDLADLVTHYRDLLTFKEGKDNLYNNFPQTAQKADLENFKLIYSKLVEDDELMKVIESIINYSLPKFQYYLAEGKKIYDFVEEHLRISPVGISPLHPFEGYLILKNGNSKEAQVYEYQITIFNDANEKYRAIHTQFVSTFKSNLKNTFEAIKSDLISYNKKLPNPATYAIESEMVVPTEETLLPIAKRVLVKYLAQNNAA